MKKIMMAAVLGAALGGNALAQSSVQVMGTIDTFAGGMKMAGDAARSTVVNSSGMTTSWFGFRGTEDLGGGLKANFALTAFLRTDAGAAGRFGPDPFWSRDANVGFLGSWGAVTVGRGLAPNFLPTILFNPVGDSFTFSPLVLHNQRPACRYGLLRARPDQQPGRPGTIHASRHQDRLAAGRLV